MSNSIIIEYGAQSMLSRWFDDYWTDRERKLMPWLFVLILCALTAYGPALSLWLLSFLPVDQLGSSGASLRAHQLLQVFAGVITLSVAVGFAKLVVRPSLIELTDDGIRKIWMLLGLIPIRGNLLCWNQVRTIKILKDAGSNDQLVFGSENETTSTKLSIRDLAGDELRVVLIDAIAQRCNQASVDSNVFDILMPQRALSFTEIWLNALSAPPGRERLLPIAEGTLLGERYAVVKKLGSGGQGTVYLAQDTHSRVNVVLKETILPVYADLITRKQALEAFHREAFALESVSHENIVKFRRSFVADHRAYLVLDFIDGKTLSATIAHDGPRPAPEAIELGLAMCEVLSALHNLTPALVHRDFTPDNLIVADRRKLVLIDFAVAVAGDKDSTDVAGKIAYMPPEQLQGKPTVQSDIYALGCTMFYVLTGHHPDPLDECHPILINDSVPKELNELVAECTRLDTKRRYENIGKVKSALQAIARV